MGGEHDGRGAALTELRERLADGLARKDLTMTQLASLAGRSRTTVHQAFQSGGLAPSAATVAALARVLGLPVEQLLALRRTAADEDGPDDGQDEDDERLGRPIGKWDPHDLEVHPAAAATAVAGSGGWPQRATLPGYVRRAHDFALAEVVRAAAEGESRMLVLVGSSSTGKTRACWEAVQPLAALGWRLWHPHDPSRAEAALADLVRVGPSTVVWLNEAQHYLGDPQAGERIAATLRTLLTNPGRQPVLVLGTLWPEYANTYTAPPFSGGPDPHSQVRELLAGRTLTVPDVFDEDALRTATTLANAGDQLLADALTRARTHGRLTQDLAGAPELLRRFEQGAPAARALLEAAMDARRLGVGPHLPQAFLTDAAADYLTDHDWDQLTEGWAAADGAYADLARPVHGKQAPLRHVNTRPRPRPPGDTAPAATPAPGPILRLADYLEQHGRITRRRLCPPVSFWHAAHVHLTQPDDLTNLASAAADRHRLQWAHCLRLKAADASPPDAPSHLTALQKMAGDRERAATRFEQAAADNDDKMMFNLATGRNAFGDQEGAEVLAWQAADAGHPHILVTVAALRPFAESQQSAANNQWRTTDTGTTDSLIVMAVLAEQSDRKGAETFYQMAADAGHPYALVALGRFLEAKGDPEGAETFYRRAAHTGHPYALVALGRFLEAKGDPEGAETFYRRAADTGWSAPLAGRWPYGLDADGSPTPAW